MTEAQTEAPARRRGRPPMVADPAERYKRYAVNRERMKTDKPLQVAG